MLKEWLHNLSGRDRGDDVRHKLKLYISDNNASTILRLVLENPGITADRIAQRTGLDATTIGGYLNGMMANGLVVVEDGGFHIAGRAKAAVVEHLPLNYQCPGMMRE